MASTLPPLDIPHSTSCVKVSIIDTTTRIGNVPTSAVLKPSIGTFQTISFPSYSFLIESEAKGQKILFDLGTRKDVENIPKPILGRIKDRKWTIQVDKDVAEILTDHNIPLSSINAIVWSHCHFDHQGNPTTFPISTSLIVGPDGLQRCVPPADHATETLPMDPAAVAGREVRQLSATATSNIRCGDFPAVDYFGDGSFYLLFAPGHTADHLCGLARTTVNPPGFIFMAADAVHHAGEHRPSVHLPLPGDIASADGTSACPCEVFLSLHPRGSRTEPFQHAAGGEDKAEGQRTVSGLATFDAHQNVMCVGAHDATLLDVIDFFPKSANDWMVRGWRERSLWRFLYDYTT